MEFIQIIIYVSIYLGLIATSFYVLSFLAGKKKKELLFEDKELPKVSVIIPVYNEEGSIARTLDSILASEYPKEKLEIIVVDNNSNDNTLKIARQYQSKGIKIYTEKKQGKGYALNLGIKKCKGEIFFSMDADTIVENYSLKSMVRYFKDKEIMCVSPAIVTYKPKNIWQRIQHIEYLLGIFLRKTFAFLNSVHITPGAFSAYRKSFIEKYGGYKVDNITEDLELTLRIQFHGYRIENDSNAPVYTNSPSTFMHLLKQRRRWYVGLLRNLWDYRKIITPKYGDMGAFVIPIALISIIFSVFITFYFLIKTIFDVKRELIFLNSVNFDFPNVFSLNLHFFERYLFLLFTNSIFLFILVFVTIIATYLFYASKRLGRVSGLALNLPLYFLGFSVLFGFWWIISLIYIFLNKKVSWK